MATFHQDCQKLSMHLMKALIILELTVFWGVTRTQLGINNSIGGDNPAFNTFLFATSGPCLYLFIFILDPAFLFSNSGPSWCSWSSLSIKSQFICFLVFLYDQTLSLYCNLQVLLCLCFRMRYTPVVNLCCPQKILSVLYTFTIYPYLDIPLPGYLLGIF